MFVLTAAPAEVGPRPVLASALVNELRTALVLIARAVAALTAADPSAEPALTAAGDDIGAGGVKVVPVEVAAVTVPPGALVVAVPGGVPPEVAT